MKSMIQILAIFFWNQQNAILYDIIYILSGIF